MTQHTPTQDDSQRVIGVIGATAIGIGGMVGGGIFAVLGVASDQAGGATPIAFLFAGVIASLTGYSYSKLSVRYQSAGGTVTFVDKGFGVSDLTGTVNIVLWAGYIATTALYASAFANYAAALISSGAPASALVLRLLMGVAIVGPLLINMVNARLVSRSEGVVVAIKLTILAVVIVAGVPSIDVDKVAPTTWPSMWGVIAAGMLIFVAYEGFELIANASADVKNPAKNLPRAFGLSIGLVLILYIAIAFVVVGTLTPQQIAESADYALAEAASSSLGQIGFTLVGLSAILATFSAINATLYGSGRLAFTIATEGELPEGFTTRVWRQPIGLYLTAGLALTIAVGLPIESLSSLASAIFLMIFTVVNAAAVRCGPDANISRPVAVLGTIACFGALAVLVVRSIDVVPTSMLVLVILLATVLTVEHRYLKHHRRPIGRRTAN